MYIRVQIGPRKNCFDRCKCIRQKKKRQTQTQMQGIKRKLCFHICESCFLTVIYGIAIYSIGIAKLVNGDFINRIDLFKFSNLAGYNQINEVKPNNPAIFL